MEPIPIKTAKDVAKKHNLKQVIIFGWDGERTHVITYGETVEDCDQAAQGATVIKRGWGWPEEITNIEPNRVTKMKERIKELEERIKKIQLEQINEKTK